MNERRSLADSLEGAHSVGAVKWDWFAGGTGGEGPQLSRPPSIIVAMNEWRSLADSLEGDRSVGAVKMVLIYGRKRLQPERSPKPSPLNWLNMRTKLPAPRI